MAKRRKKIYKLDNNNTVIRKYEINIPNVVRVGNYIEVTFHEMKMPKTIFKETRYPRICEVLLDENDEPLIPHLIIGSAIYEMECQGDGRWSYYLPKKAEIVLKFSGQEYDCGRI